MQEDSSDMRKLREEVLGSFVLFPVLHILLRALLNMSNTMRDKKDHRVLALKEFQNKDYEDVLK